MELILTDHTKKRMRERNIKFAEIKNALEMPDYSIKKEGKSEVIKRIDNKELKIVYVNEGKFIKILSVMWR